MQEVAQDTTTGTAHKAIVNIPFCPDLLQASHAAACEAASQAEHARAAAAAAAAAVTSCKKSVGDASVSAEAQALANKAGELCRCMKLVDVGLLFLTSTALDGHDEPGAYSCL